MKLRCLAGTLAAACLSSTATVAVAAAATPQWSQYQGNAQHTGYVPIALRPQSARKAWEWRSPHAADGVTAYINPVAISDGVVAVTDDDYFAPQALYLLDERSGETLQTYEFPASTPALNPPAIFKGTVFVATSGHEETFMHAFDVVSGTLLWKTPFPAQWPHYLSPAIDGRLVANGGGYYGGVYGFDRSSGAVVGSRTDLPMIDMFSPALDDKSIYAYTHGQLNVIDRKTFAKRVIADPAPDSDCCGSYIGAPMVSLERQRVVAPSGDDFSGRASASTAGHYERSLVSFDIAAGVLEWRSAERYVTRPALAQGRVFAGGQLPARLAVLDETTGVVDWTWTPEDGSTRLCRNIVVTLNHVFVSTDRAVHAIDLATRRSVWSVPVAGELALSARGTLTINEGCTESTGRLLAYRLPTQR